MVVLERISKSFPGTRALDEVSLEVRVGTIHALLGENGSGKSTAVKVLTGVYQPDSGSIGIAGRKLPAISSPAEATRLGVRAVQQETPLVDTLSVAECVALFHAYPTGAGQRIRWRTLVRQTRELLDELAIDVDPLTLASRLTPAQRAQIGLAIAVGRRREDTGLLVLDEATAALPETEANGFLERIATIARAGIGVLMVTHRLGELAFADEVTVLRDGRVVHRGDAGGVSDEFLIAQMVGKTELVPQEAGEGPEAEVRSPLAPLARLRSSPVRRRSFPGNGPALEVSGLSGEVLRDVTFAVERGEIVGVAGLQGSGVDELPLLISGVTQRKAGAIRIAGLDLPYRAGPRDALRAGLALVPADRLRQGGVRSMSVADNVLLPEAGRYWHRPRLKRRAVRAVLEELDVRPRAADALFGQLSGGNQQKAILGKWLLLQPRVLVLDDPTYGVDPGARRQIFRTLHAVADERVAVLMRSTEPEQLVALCNRVLVIRDGTLTAELRGDDLNLETLTRWCWA